MNLDFSDSFYNEFQEYNQTGSTQDYAYSPFSSFSRCKGCNKNLTSNNPATRYQIQKRIQNTVRVPSSIYTMNLGALNVYQKPDSLYKFVKLGETEYLVSPGVNWNQMSDRSEPHVQVVVSGSGSTYGANSLRRSITRLRPGALSPGGVGVDIKHNSYYRYLARIKGQRPLRREPVPKAFALPFIPFDLAYPIRGGKLFKTSIVSNCNCVSDDIVENNNDIIYQGSIIDEIYNIKYNFSVEDIVLALKPNTGNNSNNFTLYKAKIIAIEGNGYVRIRFLDDNVEIVILANLLKVYFPLKTACLDPCLPARRTNLNYRYSKDQILVSCVLFNYLENGKIASTLTQ